MMVTSHATHTQRMVLEHSTDAFPRWPFFFASGRDNMADMLGLSPDVCCGMFVIDCGDIWHVLRGSCMNGR